MTLADEINQMIKTVLESSTWTSAGGNNPIENFIKEFRGVENPDLEALINKPEITNVEQKSNFTKNLKGMTADDAKGVLGKAGIDPKNLPNLIGLAGGKGGLSFLTGIGGAAGLATLLSPIAIGLAIKPVTQAIIKELQRPGGFLDKRVKIDARNEAFAEIDRQTRQNTRIGDRQVIIQQFEGFRNFQGFASTNTSVLIRENADRVLDIGLFDRAQGMSLSDT